MSAVGRHPENHAALMDGVYRRQRHIYDATRKYYLLGRDRLLANLEAPAEGTVLEVGCGTGRNMVLASRLYPEARLFGLDISTEMLRTAATSLAKEGIASSVFYPLPLHHQPAYVGIAKNVSLPVAEKVAKSVLSLPIHPLLDEASIDRIAACVRAAA